ncbi:MAG: class I SAM-dependent rRNA methyltransferase [Bacteroidales bacterium]|nr:class I SAM-dependent rRNA methyltransferase [Bacteroidales bacterium]
MFKQIILHKGKERSLQRFHPWIFSGAVAKKSDGLFDGDIVEVLDWQRNYLATGHYFNSSLCVKLFSFEKTKVDYQFWKSKIFNAVTFRKSLGFIDNETTTMFRLINGEGDGMPGLIVDWFDGNVVMQFHSYGMFLLRDMLVQIFLEIFGDAIKSIYDKSESTLTEVKGFSTRDELLYGNIGEVLVKENGIPFEIDIVNGQKTGFFIDQRESRALVGQYARHRNVLNLFCYTGGFSLYAIEGGADLVHSVDISQKAMNITERNVARLKNSSVHQSFTADVFDFLDNMSDDFYDLVVLDPPAFAKHYNVKEQGIKGYRNINRKALSKVKKGGFLFTFSCSQAISKEDFKTIVFSAAALEHKQVRIVKHLEQGADHPVDIFHPEGGYLKGLMVYVS